jgi:hypothetical protein
MPEDQSTPKIHIDSDWKAEAQKEKERLTKKEHAKAGKPGAAAAGAAQPGQVADKGEARLPHELPEASFRGLVGMLASQAVMGLGALADPQTNRVVIDPEGARFAIDLLDVLEQKTKGNLTDEEAKELRQILAELRGRYVQIMQMVARQMAAPSQSAGSPAGAAGQTVQP